MFGRPRQDIRNPHAPDVAVYRKGWILTNGALEYVYRKTTLYPLICFNGPGVFVQQQLSVIPTPQSRAELALTIAPIVGAGVPASSIDFQSLTQAGGSVHEP